VGEGNEFHRNLEEILLAISAKYRLRKEENLQFYQAILQQFHTFRGQENIDIQDAWVLDFGAGNLLMVLASIDSVIKFDTHIAPMISTHKNDHLLCLLETAADFPETLITPKTLRDKFVGLFSPSAAMSGMPGKFSEKYHCLSADEERLQLVIKKELPRYLATIRHISLEFFGHSCLVQVNSSLIRKKETLQLIEASVQLSSMLGAK